MSCSDLIVPNLAAASGRRAGFTLVELLLAMVIVAVCMTGVYAVFNAGIMANARATALSRVSFEGSFFLDRISSDLRCAMFIDPGKMPPDENGREPRIFTGASDSIEFYSAASRSGDITGADRRLRYFFDKPDHAALGSVGLECLPAAGAVPLVDEPSREVLIERVRRLSLRYLRDAEWVPEWTDDSIPSAVEITIEIESDDSRFVREFTAVVDVPVWKAARKS